MHPSDAIVALVSQVFGSSIQYHVQTTPATEPIMAGTLYAAERTEAISDLTQSIGAEVLFDAYGDFVVRPSYKSSKPPPVVDDQRGPAWRPHEGGDDARPFQRP